MRLIAMTVLAAACLVASPCVHGAAADDNTQPIPSIEAEIAALIERADAAMVSGAVHEAYRLYRAALAVAPGDRRARDGQHRARHSGP